MGEMSETVYPSLDVTCLKGDLVHFLFTSHQREDGGPGDACCESPGGGISTCSQRTTSWQTQPPCHGQSWGVRGKNLVELLMLPTYPHSITSRQSREWNQCQVGGGGTTQPASHLLQAKDILHTLVSVLRRGSAACCAAADDRPPSRSLDGPWRSMPCWA